MTCKGENNILCNSNGSHLSGQTHQVFFCSSASALSLPSSAQCLWVIHEVYQCHSELQAWHQPYVLIPVPQSLHIYSREAEQLQILSFLPIAGCQTSQPSFSAEVPNDSHRGWAGRKAHMLLQHC